MRYLLIFIAIVASYTPAIEAAIPESEKKALLAISEFVDSSFLTQEWLKNETQPCQWKGVSCNIQQQHVIKLDFSFMVATEISPKISLLPALEELNLTGNYLTSLPAEIGQLKALTTLNLSRNQLQKLPSEIGNLTALKHLNVSYNLLTELPPEIGHLKNLQTLYANSNQIIKVPDQIKALPQLSDFQLQTNWRREVFNPAEISETIQEIVKKIADKGIINGEAVGISGDRTEQYDNFIELKKLASQTELLLLVNHPNPAVRSYAFWALTEYQNIDLLPIIKNHLNDNEIVDTTFGCLGQLRRAGDFFVKVATSDSGWIRQTSSKKLPANQLQRLDQMLTKLPNDFYAQNEALLRIKPNPALYPRIRHLLIDEHNPAALVALAKYQKEQDIPLIIKSLVDQGYYMDRRGYSWLQFNPAYLAVQSFTHPAFFSHLEKDLLSSINNTGSGLFGGIGHQEDIYHSIAHYQDSKAIHLLTMPLENKLDERRREDHYKARFCAAKQVDIDFYEPLLWSFWEKQYTLDTDVFSYLLKKDPERALNLTIQSLKNIEPFFNINSFVCGKGNNRIPLTNTLLDLAYKKQPQWTIDLIAEFIKSGVDKYQLTPLMMKKASEIKAPSFIPLLFEQLEKQQQKYYDYQPLVRALLAFKNEKINARLKKTTLKNNHLSDIKKDDEFNALFE